MKKSIFPVITLVATAGFTQTPEDLKVAKAAIREAHKDFFSEGMIGLREKSGDIHKAALGKKDRASMIRSVAFDFQCHLMDSSMAEATKVDPYPFFTMTKMSERWNLLFNARKIKDNETIKRLIKFIETTAKDESDKLASE